jgi:hypothetical protein
MNPLNNNRGFTMLAVALSIVLIPTMVLVATQQYSISTKTASLQHSTSTKNNFVSVKNWIISTSKDIDSDSSVELLKEGTGNTLPTSIPIRTTDDWGGQIKYYTWDLATANTNVLYSQNNTAPPLTDLIGRIISAGKDGIFQNTNLTATSLGDDIVFDIFKSDSATNSDNSGWKEDVANNKVTLKTPGRWVGIGTDTPVGNLTVASSTGANISITTNQAYGSIATPLYPTLDFLGFANSKKAQIRTSEKTFNTYGSDFHISVNNGANATSLVDRFTILENGNIGIDTTNPQSKLHVANDGYATFGPNSSWGATLRVGGNGNVDNNASIATTNGNLHLDAGSGAYATYINYYKGTGGINFGNGASAIVAKIAPNGQMDTISGGYISSGNVAGTGNAAYFPSGGFFNGATNWIYGAWNYFNGILTDTSSRWQINPTGPSWFNGGNFGIGTTTPGTKLDVNGNIRAASEIYPSSGVGGYIYGDGNGIRTSGNLLSNANIYWGTKGIWLDSYLNQAVLTTSSPTFATVYTNNWFRSYGATGWYNQTYGGGIYMTDTTWVRTYNNKSFRTEGTMSAGAISSDSSITSGGNLTFTGANPTISSTTGFITIPNGMKFTGGTVQSDVQINANGGLKDTAHANLSLRGGTSGNTKIEGVAGTNGLIFPDGTLQKTAIESSDIGKRYMYTFIINGYSTVLTGIGWTVGSNFTGETLPFQGGFIYHVYCGADPVCAQTYTTGSWYSGGHGGGWRTFVKDLPVHSITRVF